MCCDEHVVVAERGTLDFRGFFESSLAFVEAALRAQGGTEHLQAFGEGWVIVAEPFAADVDRLAQRSLGILRAAFLRQRDTIVVEHLRNARVFLAIQRACAGERLFGKVRGFIELAASGEHERFDLAIARLVAAGRLTAAQVDRERRAGVGDSLVEAPLFLTQQPTFGQPLRMQLCVRFECECRG